MMTWIEKGSKLARTQRPLLLFIGVLLACHLLWKALVTEDLKTGEVLFVGQDVSGLFESISLAFVGALEWILRQLGDEITVEGTVIRWVSGSSFHVVGACTGVKQYVTLVLLLLCAEGGWKQKGWLIPSGVSLLIVFNLLRLTVIVHCSGLYPAIYPVLHRVWSYLFYVVIFLLWLIGEERNRSKKKKEKCNEEI